MDLTYEERWELTQQRVTLNGEPAAIMGARLPFAKVASLDPEGPSAEWAWDTVESVVKSGGDFQC